MHWETGDHCTSDCLLVACGDADNSQTITASDALVILRGAVGAGRCDVCLCNVDDSPGGVSASDALRLLRAAVGIGGIALVCPSCL